MTARPMKIWNGSQWEDVAINTLANHASSHHTGGTDALTASSIGAAATSHTHAASDVTGTAVVATLADAKGDLIAATGADAFARLAVGGNGTLLTADSTATAGVSWSARMSFRGGIAPYASNYFLSAYSNSTNDQELAEGKIVVVPVAITAGTLDRIGAYVKTGGTSGALLRFGVYASSPTTGLPTSLIVDGSTGAATTNGQSLEVTVSAAIAMPQVVWVAVVAQGGAGTIARLPRSTNSADDLMSNPFQPRTPTGVSSSATFSALRSTAATYTGALPASFPAFDVLGAGLSYCGVRVTT